MDIQQAAMYLLALRIISTIFILSVLWIQVPLLKAPGDIKKRVTRYFLFAGVLVLLFANLVPIYIDVSTIYGDLERSAAALNHFGIAYSFSNAIFSVFSALNAWGMYQFIRISNGKR